MKYVIALAAVMVMHGTALPSVAQARGTGQAGTKTATGKVPPPQPAGSKAKADPKAKAKAKAAAKPAKKTATSTAPTTAAATTNGSATAGTTATMTEATPTIPVVKNQNLEARLQPLLPAGMNVSDASKGFKNWGRFVAAVHASRNLNIPFQNLKAKMTGDMPLSLGQAIQAIRSGSTTPTAVMTHNRTATTASAVTQAEQQAAEDFRHLRDDSR